MCLREAVLTERMDITLLIPQKVIITLLNQDIASLNQQVYKQVCIGQDSQFG